MAQRAFFDVMESLAALVAGNAKLDPALSQPFDFEPETLYVWEEDRRHTSIGTGEVREDFTVFAVYVSDNGGETAIATRSREVTQYLSAWEDAALDAVRENGPHVVGGHVSANADADFLRQLAVRGSAIRMTGWRVLD